MASGAARSAGQTQPSIASLAPDAAQGFGRYFKAVDSTGFLVAVRGREHITFVSAAGCALGVQPPRFPRFSGLVPASLHGFPCLSCARRGRGVALDAPSDFFLSIFPFFLPSVAAPQCTALRGH